MRALAITPWMRRCKPAGCFREFFAADRQDPDGSPAICTEVVDRRIPGVTRKRTKAVRFRIYKDRPKAPNAKFIQLNITGWDPLAEVWNRNKVTVRICTSRTGWDWMYVLDGVGKWVFNHRRLRELVDARPETGRISYRRLGLWIVAETREKKHVA